MDDIQFQKNYSAFIYTGNAVNNVPQTTGNVDNAKTNPSNSDFANLLKQSIGEKEGVTFSKHAMQRLDSRNIQISDQLLTQMNEAVKKASVKGIKDALMISGQTAFIVNVPSKTVITTMNGPEMTNNVFTNIDGAVIL
ncbi:MAG: flagellar operon protein [Clostridiales bacterium]|nr:flagellar operon protein [Clostridiales bacterium]